MQRDGGTGAFATITNIAHTVPVPAELVGQVFRSKNLNPRAPPPFSEFSNICFDAGTNYFIAHGENEEIPFEKAAISDDPLRSFRPKTQPGNGTWQSGDSWLPGSTVMVTEDKRTGEMVLNFFHSMEHLSGTWITAGHAHRMEVKHVIYMMPGWYTPDTDVQYRFFGSHEMTAHTIRALYPNANILTWESFVKASQASKSGRLCMPHLIASDRTISLADPGCLAINKMLANVWPLAKRNSVPSLEMAQALWRYSGVAPETSAASIAATGANNSIGTGSSSHSGGLATTIAMRPVRLLYTTRQNSNRVFSDELDTRVIALLSSIPEVELTIADFAGFPFVEQVQRVARSDILFGLHGSGLTHCWWLPANATVIEIMPENTLALDYRVFAGIRGLNYVGE